MDSRPAGTSALRVVVVDASAAQRRFLRLALEADGRVSVIAEASTGAEAVALVERIRPAAVLMDLDLPVMGGLAAIERIMAIAPTPILVYSAGVAGRDNVNAAAALAAGAVDVLAKPGPDGEPDEHAADLRQRVRVAGRVKVITHPRGRLTSRTMHAGGPLHSGGPTGSGRPVGAVRVIAIGASTGGPQALATVLGALPADLAAAVVVVQHIAAGFVAGLAEWLAELVELPVAVGTAGAVLAPGTVTVAPGGGNLVVDEALRVRLEAPLPGQFHVPGIDATFASLAVALGDRAIGVLLTGMGRDGAAGLAQLHDRGAFTIAQDEPTSVVYGMPAAAVALGGVDLVAALPDIAPALLSNLRPARRRPFDPAPVAEVGGAG